MLCVILAVHRVAPRSVSLRRRIRSVEQPKIRPVTRRKCVLGIRQLVRPTSLRQTGRAVGPTAWRVRQGSVPP